MSSRPLKDPGFCSDLARIDLRERAFARELLNDEGAFLPEIGGIFFHLCPGLTGHGEYVVRET